MRPDEASKLVHKLLAAFPTSGAGDDTTVLWLGYVAKVPVEVGARAVDSLIGSCERFPSIAEWQTSCRSFRVTENALTVGDCPLCEDGYLYSQDGETVLSELVEDKFNPGAQIKVPRRCPNGCQPGGRTRDVRRALTESERLEGAARARALVDILRRNTKMPDVPKPRKVATGRYRVDLETGNAERA